VKQDTLVRPVPADTPQRVAAPAAGGGRNGQQGAAAGQD
jgi:hypothetical protein